MISIHAPMWNGELQSKDVPEFTRESFVRTVMEAKPSGSLRAGFDGKSVAVLRGGVAEGRLIGGNLSTLCASVGTPFAPSFAGKILFFEDIGEKPYRLDRMLTHLSNAGILARVAGIAVGVNPACDDPNARPGGEYRQTAADVMRDRLSHWGVPVVTGLPFGHVPCNATIPVGAKARLDARRGDLIVTESAVS